MKLMFAHTYFARLFTVFALNKRTILHLVLGFKKTATFFISSFIDMRLPVYPFVLPLSKT
jgi:hypothetical protein